MSWNTGADGMACNCIACNEIATTFRAIGCRLVHRAHGRLGIVDYRRCALTFKIQ